MRYTVSEISAKSPDMSAEEFAAFKADIAAQGQLVPIVLRGDEVVDGRKRLRACEELGLEPKVINVAPEQNAEMLSRSLNALRTHYTPSQRAMFAASMATRPRGGASGRWNSQLPVPSVADAAEGMGVNSGTVMKAKKIIREAAPEVAEAVKAGRLTLHAAKQITDKVPVKDQAKATERVIEASAGKRRQTPASVIVGAPVRRRHAPQADRLFANCISMIRTALEQMEPRAADVAAKADTGAALRDLRSVLSRIITKVEVA